MVKSIHKLALKEGVGIKPKPVAQTVAVSGDWFQARTRDPTATDHDADAAAAAFLQPLLPLPRLCKRMETEMKTF